MAHASRVINFVPGVKPQFDVTGMRFGLLTVVGYSHKEKSHLLYECNCDCGNTTYSTSSYLRRGHKTSCGCNQYKKGESVYNYTGYKEITGTKWNGIVNNAKVRNIGFFITKEDVWRKLEEQQHQCALSGLPVSFKLKTASVDRIRSTDAYTVDNIQILHKDVNKMKNNLDENHFVNLCRLIAKHR